MSTQDIGESLVGAYLRHIESCSIVVYNSFLDGEQGEVDVVGIRPASADAPREVVLCEVTTHIGGFNTKTTLKVEEELDRLRRFANATFPDDPHRFQWWAPVVPEGARTTMLADLASDWASSGDSLEFVINAEYTRRVGELVDHARGNPSATNEDAYRMLQILTRLRGVSRLL